MRWPSLGSSGIARRLSRMLGASDKRNTPFCSFQSFLPGLVQWLNPKHVLEFGPGSSSKLILEHSSARLLSFETDAGYFERAKRSIENPRFELRYSPGLTDFSTLSGKTFDLVFVDGGERVANLIGARELLDEDGVVVLHDAHREGYLPGVQSYGRGYFIENHSLLLFKNPSRFSEVRTRFPSDDHCRCKYCGTSERIQYRERVGKLLAHG